MTKAALAALLLVSCGGAQDSRGGAGEAVVVAMDHLETKGVTAWIVAPSASASRALVVALPGAPRRIRVASQPMHDVILDATGRSAFIVVERDGALALDRVAIEGAEPPQSVIPDLGIARPVLHRAGAAVVALTSDAIVAVAADGAVRALFRKDDRAIVDFACNDSQTVIASQREGALSLIGSDGELVGTLEAAISPAFVEDGELAWVSHDADAGTSTVFLLDTTTLDAQAHPILNLAGQVSRLRASGPACLLFRQQSSSGTARDWILHLATGVARPMAPRDYGGLAPALLASSRPSLAPTSVQRADAVPEPETESSGFFLIDEHGYEHKTAFEAGGFDEVRHAPEAEVHKKLLDAFLAGVQWPFRRESAYEPVIASDDEPFRVFSAVPHRGLDLGARLVHGATGSVAFHVPGTYVYPLYRGGQVWRNRAVTVRQESPSGPPASSRTFPLLQEVELSESGYLLRIHIAYEHAGGHGERPSDDAFPVDGEQAIGALDAFDLSDPSGGWATSDPALRAAGISKGSHAHVGIGGIYRSFNGATGDGARKLRWYRERLIPALKRMRPR